MSEGNDRRRDANPMPSQTTSASASPRPPPSSTAVSSSPHDDGQKRAVVPPRRQMCRAPGVAAEQPPARGMQRAEAHDAGHDRRPCVHWLVGCCSRVSCVCLCVLRVVLCAVGSLARPTEREGSGSERSGLAPTQEGTRADSTHSERTHTAAHAHTHTWARREYAGARTKRRGGQRTPEWPPLPPGRIDATGEQCCHRTRTLIPRVAPRSHRDCPALLVLPPPPLLCRCSAPRGKRSRRYRAKNGETGHTTQHSTTKHAQHSMHTQYTTTR